MKVGNFAIPDIRLFPKLLAWIEELYPIYRLDEFDDENSAAKVCGHKSANSGAWLNKKADFRLYGLMEPRTSQLTELARDIAFGADDVITEAVRTAILNVPLWEVLYNRFGPNLPESNFWVQLQRIASLDPLDAQKIADKVRRAYLEDISHIVSSAETLPLLSIETPPTTTPSRAMSAGGWSINIEVGPFSQTLPYTKAGLKLARGFIDLLEIQLNEETNEEE